MRTLAFLLVLLLSFGIQLSHAESPDEKAIVVADVLAMDAWVSEAAKCPSELVQLKEAKDHIEPEDCSPGKLKSCLSQCKKGVPGSCYWLGQAIQGEGKGQHAAEVLYQRSCKLGVPSGCTNRAAGMSLEVNSESVQACAARTFEKSCALDDPWGCTMYALHLSKGQGIPVNKELALEVLKKSCRYGPEDQACSYGRGLREQILKSKQAIQ